MANDSSAAKKPRVRKTAPSVRQQIEDSAAKTDTTPRRKKAFTPLSGLWSLVKKILKPLAPIGRFLKTVFSWLVPRYFINSWREVKKVTWPGRKETWRLTAAVFIFAVVFGAAVAIVDKGLDEIFKKVIIK